jgi:hypothetical protein
MTPICRFGVVAEPTGRERPEPRPSGAGRASGLPGSAATPSRLDPLERHDPVNLDLTHDQRGHCSNFDHFLNARPDRQIRHCVGFGPSSITGDLRDRRGTCAGVPRRSLDVPRTSDIPA